MSTYDNSSVPQGGGQNYDAPVQQQDSSNIIDYGWVKSVNGLLKAAEIGVVLIIVITSSVWESKVCCSGGGWVQFVSITSLICTTVLYVLYLVSVAEKLRSSIRVFSLVELIYYSSVVLCYFICAIVASVYGADHPSIGASAEYGYYTGVMVCLLISAIVAAAFGWRHPSIAASSFFCFLALVPYGIDTFFSFQIWRNATPPPPSLPPQQTPGSMDTMERGPQY